eukprot:SAG22_NODE_13875_length_392_cov_0.870307_1_plen_37_part_01
MTMAVRPMFAPHPADTNPSEPVDTLYSGFKERQRLQR